ncbi:bestrophin family protein [Xanthovirga aplysinae]|uniref:bestrophin family protein n=1 Tax=Xanthovirga aplysinae TaxID=2529853 RepID=UPI0012BBAE58|nr:bestrophin family ion channel [Xanthovirga aplysinae]MTI32366.1 hypothetical protein [Xanthovirga aplysinae]
MFITKNFNLKNIIQFSGVHIIWLTLWVSFVAFIYEYFELSWLVIPWLPLSVIGTAVAFYVGFKNNSAYDRMWEARKIWGAIINSSRSWGTHVKNFISNYFTNDPVSKEELKNIKQRLIYRHLAWLYALRSQLLVVTPWEHANQRWPVGKKAKKYRKRIGTNLDIRQNWENEVKRFLSVEEYDHLINFKNSATQIIDHQAQELAFLREKGLMDDFRHMEMQRILSDFYDHQGKCERIKKFPLPRQYGSMSFIFVGIFIFLLPFGMVSEFSKLGEWGLGLAIPFTVLIGWVFVVMELVGDYSENPFQGMANDVPMLSLCRVIENDLREMLGETDLRPDIQPKNGVLM